MGFCQQTEGSICEFNGIECWHPDEAAGPKHTPLNMGLRGQLPIRSRKLHKHDGLDLSNNDLSGALPGNIDKILPFVTSVVDIPCQFRNLTRLTKFDASDNPLSGELLDFATIPLRLCSFVKQRQCQTASANNSRTKKFIILFSVGGICGGTFVSVFFCSSIAVELAEKKDDMHIKEDIEGDHWQSRSEFLTELTTLGRESSHLVSLQGFCIARKEKLLVYEYMPKRNLFQQLHQIEDNTRFKEWPLRLKIALGVARGLSWLHHNCNPRIVHCDITSKCILLDQDNEPRISDFWYAQLLNPHDTHLTTFVDGKYHNMGYVAPEIYAHVGGLSKGSLTCISCEDDLLEFLKIASACVASLPQERPTMLHVYQRIREIGNRYGFSADDEVQLQPNNINNHASTSAEQNESHEICEIQEMYELEKI
ncbi:putative inactive leucine-rich repeat receptor-like protein kinase [Cinnamomum micranthum f. kanehirae]|uniref:Putative inactive leucine-rich repeat receptor-like protein kinase n=1 Tax=Cinnamomum micranthum f. kanehirae TaxID=337451 RepID=A0A443Q144_9MAGN|nr:putative inactive leucine-rich repeat receptor-like protein kinase [Cinnamomum micranthum f. kanehirae]